MPALQRSSLLQQLPWFHNRIILERAFQWNMAVPVMSCHVRYGGRVEGADEKRGVKRLREDPALLFPLKDVIAPLRCFP